MQVIRETKSGIVPFSRCLSSLWTGRCALIIVIAVADFFLCKRVAYIGYSSLQFEVSLGFLLPTFFFVSSLFTCLFLLCLFFRRPFPFSLLNSFCLFSFLWPCKI